MIKTCKDLNIELCWNCRAGKEPSSCAIERYKSWIAIKPKLELLEHFQHLSTFWPADKRNDALLRFRKALELHCPQRLEQLEKLLILL